MAEPQDVPGRGFGIGGWSLAAAIGLVAAAFSVQRSAPANNEEFPSERKGGRDASLASLGSEGEDHGRHADAPSEIPAKGWKDILLRVYDDIGQHRILALAAGITYYAILAIFPALAALVAIYGCFPIHPASPSIWINWAVFYREEPSTWHANSSRVSRPKEARRRAGRSSSAQPYRFGAPTQR